MEEKDQLLATWQREFATTSRVLAAFPKNRANFRPHERSSSALEIAWTLAIAFEALTDLVLGGAREFLPTLLPAPASWDEAVEKIERAHQRFVLSLGRSDGATLGQPIRTPVGPGTTADVPRGGMIWLLLLDHVHHRGQLTVYLRMVGGKVPSIYGPSADEPWTAPGDQAQGATGAEVPSSPGGTGVVEGSR